MILQIPVAFGIEAATKREIERLGLGHAPAERGHILLEGDWNTVARLNVFLRAGERVLIELARFSATTFDELFEGTFAIPWEEYLGPHACIRIDGKSVKSRLAAVKASGGIVKKAILKRLGERLHISSFDERGERAVVGLSLFEDEATVTLDTTGEGLHRRGYRVLTGDAPLRETVAAAIVEDSLYRRDKYFTDPFCGSGTIPIEAVLYARSIAPGKKRTFDFQRFRGVAPETVVRAREEAESLEYRGPIAPVFASDCSEHAIRTAETHAERAGVLGDILFSVADMRRFTASEPYGVLISNPPYGERLEKGEDLFPLYHDFSRMFRALPDWSAYVLSAYDGCERAFGRPDKRRILYNADLKCSLLTYFGKKPTGNDRILSNVNKQ